MRPMRRFLVRLMAFSGKQRAEERLRSEIEEHIALQTDENMRAGLPEAEARRQARIKFGAVEALREGYREQRGLPFVELLVQDTRHAVRRLLLAPAYTITSVLILALGIGATTSIFTLINAILLQSLPVARPNELYKAGRTSQCCYTGGYVQDGGFALFSYQLYEYLRDHTRGFTELAAFPAGQTIFGVRRAGHADTARSFPGEYVSGNYFRTFGIYAAAGRLLTASDDRPAAPPTAVMSYRLWREEYGSDPSIVGAVFNLNDKPFTIVGVTPREFFGETLRSAPPDFFLPLNMEPVAEVDADLNKYDTHWLNLIGRVQPGANPAAIELDMRLRLQEWLRSHESEMTARDRARLTEQTLYLAPGGAGITSLREQYELWLQVLMGVTGFVLLIACANLANLTLVRGMERRRQMSLSMALGAQSARLVRQVLTESLLLSLAGGAAGLAVAFVGARLILYLAFPSTSGATGMPIDTLPSIPVLAFAFAASIVTALAFGAGPAWMATRTDPIEALRGSGRGVTRARARLGKLLVVMQAALTLVLLSAAGLLTTALEKIETQDFGFQQKGHIVTSFNSRLGGYRKEQLPELYRKIRDSLSGVPGVESAALCLYAPQTGWGWGGLISVEGHAPAGPHDDVQAYWSRVTAGYLDVIGTKVLRGRGITEHDTASSPKVAVISEAFARKFFRGEDPIGRRFNLVGSPDTSLEVVGIAQDARYLNRNFNAPVEPFYYAAADQADYHSDPRVGSLFLRDIVIAVIPGARVTDARIRLAMAAVDPNLPIVSIRSLDGMVSSQFTQQRLIARLASCFGVLALVLASIGLYGVMAYNAGSRINEVGVRMALGAARGQVVRLILRGAASLIVPGVAAGITLAFAADRLLQNQLYGVNPYDPGVMLIAVLVLCASAILAALLPALRASMISPTDALRVE